MSWEPTRENGLSARTPGAIAVLLAVCGVSALGVAACQRTTSPSDDHAQTSSSTATDFSGVNLNDTKESGTYAVPGEELAKKAGSELIGKQAPAASMRSIDGQMIDLGRIFGKKPVYIKFWATWCVPCRQQMPAFEKMYESLGDKIQFVALDIGLSDDLDSIKTFKEKYSLKMPIVMDDGSLAKAFNLRVTPQHVLIGRDAKFAYFGHADNEDLANAIKRVLAQPQMSGPFVSPSAAATIVTSYKVGDVITDVSARATERNAIQLRATPGRLRGVLFFSSWCEWYLEKSRPVTAKACARARETISAMAARKDSGVDWVGVSGGPWSSADDLSAYRTKHKVTIPFVLDDSGDLFRSFGIRDIPTVVLINSHSKIVKIVGPGEADIAGAVMAARKEL